MGTEQMSFEKRIKQFLKNQPGSDASRAIMAIAKSKSNFYSYQSLLEDYAFESGIGTSVTEVLDKKGNIKGFVPSLVFYSGNLLGREPGELSLTSKASPLSLAVCYSTLAKELVYKLILVVGKK